MNRGICSAADFAVQGQRQPQVPPLRVPARRDASAEMTLFYADDLWWGGEQQIVCRAQDDNFRGKYTHACLRGVLRSMGVNGEDTSGGYTF